MSTLGPGRDKPKISQWIGPRRLDILPDAMNRGDLRTTLQAELIRRCKVNPKYSMRSFARSLRMDPSLLSKVLRGERSMNLVTFKKVAESLNWAPSEQARLSPVSQRARLAEYRQLTLDHFEVISEWHHYAILELTQIRGFKPDVAWVAQALGITPVEARSAVERLERLGFLKITSSGKWIDESGAVTTVGNEFTAMAFRRLQKQVLEKAMEALESVPLELRDQSSMTMAVNSKRISAAKERIKKFRRKLCAYLKSGGPKDQVYHLGVSLYPVTRALTKGTQS